MANKHKKIRNYLLAVAVELIVMLVVILAIAQRGPTYKPPPIATPGVVFRANAAEKLPMPPADWQYDADQMLLFSIGSWEGGAVLPSVGFYNWRENELYKLPIPDLNPLQGYWLAQSPDSSLIAYSTLGNLHLYNVDSETSITVTQGADPAFSPTGEFISIWRDNKLIALNQESFSEEVLYESPDVRWSRDKIVSVCCTTWSPSGTKIAYNIQTEVNSQNKGFQQGGEKLVVLDLSTRQESVVAAGKYLGAPAWSPDGRLIAYIDYPGRDYSVLRLIDSEEKCVVGELHLSAISDSFWPPHGEVIAVTDGGEGLFFIDVGKAFGATYPKLRCPR